MSNRRNRARGILLVFVLCGACDFVWGYIHERSVLAGVTGIVLGLFGTAWYLFLLGGWKNGD